MFVEGVDWTSVPTTTPVKVETGYSCSILTISVTADMAKNVAMMSKTAKKFKVKKKHKALMSDPRIMGLKSSQLKKMTPKALFAALCQISHQF